jgi:hypothetical protein
MSAPAVLDPSKVSLSILGVAVSGYAQGSFIELAYVDDETSEEVGSDGEIVVVRSKNRMATLKLTLNPTAAANDLFNAAAEAFRNGVAGGIGSMLLKDLTGRALASAESAWVKTRPALTFGKEVSDMHREWVFAMNPVAITVGGNY